MLSPQRLALALGVLSPQRLALALGVATALLGPAGWGGAAEGDPSQAGAYCRLPEPGQKPACLAPAQAKYGDFFSAVEEGTLSDAATAQIAADLEGSEGYLALSSLAYGYWQLALQAAEAEQVDPELASRLDEWNELLSAAYTDAESDPAFRSAVREAAEDLQARTPAEGFACLDASGEPTQCQPAAALLSRIEGLDDQLGVRGAVRRVLERLFGEQPS